MRKPTNSELELLRAYAPNVEEKVLAKLLAAFTDLRDAVDTGKLAYPYSTRELVNLARHLEKYPTDGVALAVQNVFAFDQHNSLALATLRSILHRHGIPAFPAGDESRALRVRLASPVVLPPPAPVMQWFAQGAVLTTRLTRHAFKMQAYEVLIDAKCVTEDVVPHRLSSFSECLVSFVISGHHGRAVDCVATPDGAVHVLTTPLSVHTYHAPDYSTYDRIDLSDYLSILGAFGSEVQMHVLGALDDGRGAVALVGAASGVCLVLHHAQGGGGRRISVCHSQLFQDFLREQLAEGGVTGTAESTWQGLWGMKHKGGARQQRDQYVKDAKEQVEVDGLQCVALEDGQSLCMYVVGGSQVAILNFNPKSPALSLLHVGGDKGAGMGAGGGGGILRIHPLLKGKQEAEQEEVRGMTGAVRWSWLMQTKDGSLFHANLAQALTAPPPGTTVLWVPLQQQQLGEAGHAAVASCVKEIEGLDLGEPGSQGSGGSGVCMLQADEYFYLYADTSLAQIDFESAARGFVGVIPVVGGGGHGLTVHGVSRAVTHSDEAGLAASTVIGDVRPVILSNGSVVTARFGTLPKAVVDESKHDAGGVEGNTERETGPVLEVVDAAAGLVTEVSAAPPREIKTAEQDAEAQTTPRSAVRMVKLAPIPVDSSTDLSGDLVSLGHQTRGREVVGVVVVWRMAGSGRDVELKEWRKTMGIDGKDTALRMTRMWGKGKKAPESKGPKHGKAPDGKRHAGGNTWAGGTGGSDTAGMGGRGGPYRLDLDDGHPVMQMSDEEKAQVSEESKAAARAMAQEALSKRLQEIGMSSFEDSLYRRFYDPVAIEIQELRVILAGVEARAAEREVQRLQMHGELDDARIVDGAAGDSNIYRRRAEKPPDPGAPQMRPKRLRFVLDVSGSMYRFNSEDRRLERCCQVAVMLMEALAPFGHKYQWSLVGHSGVYAPCRDC